MTRRQRKLLSPLPRPIPRRSLRRGMAVVVVLGLMSITLALSYSMLRSQVTCIQIQSNSLRRSKAQMAAMTGIQAALRAMSEPSWAGVGVPITGSLSDTESYSVTVETGDASLTPPHPDYAEYPYRVTLVSTGLAQDPANADQQSTHRLRVVVQLVRRKLADPPSGWSQVTPYTVYQWSDIVIHYELPVRVEGRCYLQGPLGFCDHYPDGSNARRRYLEDLTAMQSVGHPDHRPFNGPLYLPFSRNPDRSLLTNELGLSVNDISASNSRPFSHPGNIAGYRLYPGGEEYQPQTLPGTLEHVTLGPDPVTNPLGVFSRHGALYLDHDVTFQGFVLTWGGDSTTDVRVIGENVVFQALPLPALAGDSNIYQLPAVAAEDDIHIYPHATGSIQGAAYAGDDFEVLEEYTDVDFHIRGRLVCGELELKQHAEWDALYWEEELDYFEGQAAIPYFPEWIEEHNGLAPDPVVTVKPDTSGVIHHWHDWSQPLFVPHPDEGGLRWEVVDWKDGI